jgi:hypothetical protein
VVVINCTYSIGTHTVELCLEGQWDLQACSITASLYDTGKKIEVKTDDVQMTQREMNGHVAFTQQVPGIAGEGMGDYYPLSQLDQVAAEHFCWLGGSRGAGERVPAIGTAAWEKTSPAASHVIACKTGMETQGCPRIHVYKKTRTRVLAQMVRAVEHNNSFLLHVDERKTEANSSDRGETQNQADLIAEGSSASSSGHGVEPTDSVTSILTVLHIEEGDEAMLLAQQLRSSAVGAFALKTGSVHQTADGRRNHLLTEDGRFLLVVALRHGSLFSGSSAQMASSPKFCKMLQQLDKLCTDELVGHTNLPCSAVADALEDSSKHEDVQVLGGSPRLFGIGAELLTETTLGVVTLSIIFTKQQRDMRCGRHTRTDQALALEDDCADAQTLAVPKTNSEW